MIVEGNPSDVDAAWVTQPLHLDLTYLSISKIDFFFQGEPAYLVRLRPIAHKELKRSD
jgi:hypothetical protein